MPYPLASVRPKNQLSGLVTPFPITINFDGDGNIYFDNDWDESGGNVTNDQIALGAELVVNGDFSAWTGDDPDGWTVAGEVGADPEVSEVGAGQGHGGAGNGLANLFSTASAIALRQTILVVDSWYQIALDIDTRNSGTLRVGDTSSGIKVEYTTTGNKFITGRAKSTVFQTVLLGAGDITEDDVTTKLFTFTSLLNDLKCIVLLF